MNLTSTVTRSALLLLVTLALALFGCAGDDGSKGPPGERGAQGETGQPGEPGQPGSNRGSVAGLVTNSLTGAPVPGATITLDPPAVPPLATDGSGTYRADVPIGVYRLTIQKEYFLPQEASLSVVADGTSAADVALDPLARVLVEAGATRNAAPGDALTLESQVAVLDGSSLLRISWSQSGGAPATVQPQGAPSALVTLPGPEGFRNELLALISRGRGLLDRWGVQGVSRAEFDAARTVTLAVAVETTSGTYTDSVAIETDLAGVLAVAPGLRDVPVGAPVLLNGVGQPAYAWQLTAKPEGSAVVLEGATSRNPVFAPDLPGRYNVSETLSGQSFVLFAGTRSGVVTGTDAGGPQAGECETCHRGQLTPDVLSPWRASAHAAAFAAPLSKGGDFGRACYTCHSVDGPRDGLTAVPDPQGYTTFASDAAFFQGGAAIGGSGAWADMVARYPRVARLAGVQCESCHGPQAGPPGEAAHTAGEPRLSLSAEVCASCHSGLEGGALFEQWTGTLHASYQTAIDEAKVEVRGARAADCGRCHTGQGFVAWSRQADRSRWIQGASGNATVQELTDLGLTEGAIHPITCATCHDPHAPGTAGDASVRIQGSVPRLQAGFEALGVGKGAVCVSCHNTRVGPHNDAEMVDVFTPITVMNDRNPHVSQADVLMGQNAFFVQVGGRAPHSLLTDTCVTCHMQAPEPGGLPTHTYQARPEGCSRCHGAMDAAGVQAGFEAELTRLQAEIKAALDAAIAAEVAAGRSVLVKDWAGRNVLATIEAGTVFEIMDPRPYMGYATVDVKVGDTLYEMVRVGLGLAVTGPGVPAGANVLSSDAGQVIAKAAWNYAILVLDKSKGVHNPSFFSDVIASTRSQLDTL